MSQLKNLASILTNGVAYAEYPERPIRAIVPFVAGSSNDVLARLLSPLLQKALGQPMVIANMPGADGRIGIEAMAKSLLDGYTVLFSGSAISLIPSLRKNVPYDPVRDVQAVSELGVPPVQTVGDVQILLWSIVPAIATKGNGDRHC